MIKLFDSSNPHDWSLELQKFPTLNVYYKLEYCKAFECHGDGNPYLIKYEDDSGLEGICVIMVRDIKSSQFFESAITNKYLRDAVTPYGYGGFVFNREITEEEQFKVKTELTQYLSKENFVSLFIRFSPVLKNADASRSIVDVIDLGHTIYMDLSSPEIIWSNITSKNRNTIRKAEKEGVIIKHGKGRELIEQFIPIYESTMKADEAHPYYYFKDRFYSSIIEDLKNNYEIFYAEYEGKIISMAIIIFENEFMEYHLSGSIREFRDKCAGNLLLYQVALWGHEQGFKYFHLGGGLGSGEDSLYKFKAAFNRNSNLQFSIGKMIVNPEVYTQLVSLRQQGDPAFDSSSTFFPLYRS